MTITAEIAAEQVARGIALLDDNAPNWRMRIRVESLRLTDPFACVLGQVYGEYYAARVALGMSVAEAAHNGFTVDHEYYEYDECWRTLQSAWITALTTKPADA